MLLFIDEPRNLKIVRQEAEGHGRQMLGKVRKSELTLSPELIAQMTAEEIEEAEAAFDLLTEAENVRVKAALAAFPATLREVLAFYRDGATPFEQRWILSALIEGLRVVRRHDREVNAG